MTDATPPLPSKADLLRVMDEVWNDLDALLDQLDPATLDSRVPSDGPAWTVRQLFGHMLGSLQSNPYYLMQPREGAPLEGVIGDPFWRQIYRTATLASFRAMLFASHIGTVMLVESTGEAELQHAAVEDAVSALAVLHFNYHVHLRSHVDDLRKVITAQA